MLLNVKNAGVTTGRIYERELPHRKVRYYNRSQAWRTLRHLDVCLN